MANANTVYRAKKAATLTDPTSATTFKDSSDSTKPAIVYFPLTPTGTSKMFRVRAVGRVTTAGSYNWTPKVSIGTSATAGSNTIVAAATARAIATTTAVWEITVTFAWNGTSNLLKGHFSALNGSTAVLDAEAVTTSVTADLSSATSVGVTVEGTIGTGGSCFLDELSLEVL